jgi:hypothetical protein
MPSAAAQGWPALRSLAPIDRHIIDAEVNEATA